MTLYLGSIIMLPVIFGVFCLIGAWSMSEEHSPLRIGLFLLAIISVLNAMHYASIVVADINPSLSEIQNNLGKTTQWMGYILYVIIIYFLIYAFYIMVRKIAKQKEEERINY